MVSSFYSNDVAIRVVHPSANIFPKPNTGQIVCLPRTSKTKGQILVFDWDKNTGFQRMKILTPTRHLLFFIPCHRIKRPESAEGTSGFWQKKLRLSKAL